MRTVLFCVALCAVLAVYLVGRSTSTARAFDAHARSAVQPVQSAVSKVQRTSADAVPSGSLYEPVSANGASGAGNEAAALESQPAALQSSDDVKLAAQIRTVLIQDERVASVSDGVTVLVRGGMVTLQGRVKTQEQKQAVESDARGVPGVEKVENLLVVPGP